MAEGLKDVLMARQARQGRQASQAQPQQKQQAPAQPTKMASEGMNIGGGLTGGIAGQLSGNAMSFSPEPLYRGGSGIESMMLAAGQGGNPFKTGLTPPTWTPPKGTAGPGDIPMAGEGIPPTMPTRVPPRMERYETAQKMIDGYQNGWNPNPILIRLLGGR